jgi:hypothetical protein
MSEHDEYMVAQEQLAVAEAQHESALVAALKPQFGVDGNQFFFLYGEDLQSGIAGFGDTPRKAMLDFNSNFQNYQLPKGKSQ